MKQINFYNEKGNVSAKVREQVKAQARAAVLAAIKTDSNLAETVVNADGGISVPVATNERGETVYLKADLTVTVKDPTVKTERKKTAKKTVAEPVDVDLFD